MMRGRSASSWAACVLALSIAGEARAEDKKIDLRSTELYMKTLAGVATKLAPFAGAKMTLLNLWATWCGPCREEMPALDRLHKKYKPQGFQVVGLDADESGEVVKKFLAKRKLTYPVLLSTPEKTIAALGNVEALPTSLLLDETGDVLEVLVGGLEVSYVENAIEKRLGKPKPAPRPR